MVTVTIKSSGASGKYRTYTSKDYGSNVKGAAKPSEGVIGKKAGTYTTSGGGTVTVTEGTKTGGAPQAVRSVGGVPAKEVAPGVLVTDTGELIGYQQSTRESPAVAGGYKKESYAALSPGEKVALNQFYEKNPPQNIGVQSSHLIISRRGEAGEALRATTPKQLSQAIIARQEEQQIERQQRLQETSFMAQRGDAFYQTTSGQLYKYEGGQNASYGTPKTTDDRGSSKNTILGLDRYGTTPLSKTFTKEGAQAAGKELGRLGYNIFVSPIVGSYKISKYNKIYPTPFGAVAIPKGKTFAEKYRSSYLTATDPDIQQLGFTVATLPFAYAKPILVAKLGVGYAGLKVVTEPTIENVVNLGAAGSFYTIAKYQASKPQVTFGEFNQYGEPVSISGKLGNVQAIGTGNVFTTVKVRGKTFEQVTPAGYTLNIKGVRNPTVSGEISTLVEIPGKSFKLFGKSFTLRKPQTIQAYEQFTGGIETLYGTAPKQKYFTYQGMKFKAVLSEPGFRAVVEPVGSRLAVSIVDKNKVFIAESKFIKNIDLQYQGKPISDAQTYKTTGILFERNKQGFLTAKSVTKGIGTQEIIDYNKLSFNVKTKKAFELAKPIATTYNIKEGGVFGGIQVVSTGGGTKDVGGVNYRLATKGFRLLERKGISEPGVVDTNIDYHAELTGLLQSRKGQLQSPTPFTKTKTITTKNIGGAPFEMKTPIPELSGYRFSDIGSPAKKLPIVFSIPRKETPTPSRSTSPILLNREEVLVNLKSRSLPKIISEQKREYKLRDDFSLKNRSRLDYTNLYEQKQNVEQKTKLLQAVDVLQDTRQKQITKPIQVMKNPPSTYINRFTKTTPPIVPTFSFKTKQLPEKKFVFKKPKISFRESRYTPSVYAISGGIIGKPKFGSTFTGLGVRPILKSKRIGESI